MTEGAWIFLSHSSKDFDKVREVRNILEVQDHNPLMFFLKCLDDDDEIDDLIEREIEARSWFVLCDSQHARNSRWVQQEVEIIKGYPKKTYLEIDLEDPDVNLEEELSYLTKKASVFLSYVQADVEFAEQIKASLRAMDFGVFSNLEIPPGEDRQARIEKEFLDASSRGSVLILLSLASVQTPQQQSELEIAAEIIRTARDKTNIIPVFIDDTKAIIEILPANLRQAINELQTGSNFSLNDFGQTADELMQRLRDYDWRD